MVQPSSQPKFSFTPCRKMEKGGLTKEKCPNFFGGNQTLFFKTWHQASGQEGVSSECWRQKVPKDVDALIRSLEFFEVNIWSFLSWFGLFCLCRKTRNWSCKKKNGDLKVGFVKASFLKDCHFLFCKMIPNLIFFVSKGWQKYDPPTSCVCVCACVFFLEFTG